MLYYANSNNNNKEDKIMFNAFEISAQKYAIFNIFSDIDELATGFESLLNATGIHNKLEGVVIDFSEVRLAVNPSRSATETHIAVIVERLTTLLFRIAKTPNLSDRFNLQNGKVKIEIKNTQVSPELKRLIFPHKSGH
jgi:hypothetical protein